MCHKLGMPLSGLPSYPADMLPRRQLSVVLSRLSPDHFTMLQDFHHSASRESIERLSLDAQVKLASASPAPPATTVSRFSISSPSRHSENRRLGRLLPVT